MEIFDPPILPPTAQDPQFQQATPILLMSDGSERKMAWFEQPIVALPNTMRWTISSQFWRYDRTERTLLTSDGRTCLYQPAAQDRLRLSRCADTFGNAITLEWAPAEVPTELVVTQYLNGPPESATEFRAVTVTLGADGFPTAMEFAGRTWRYTSTSAVPPVGPGWAYTYDDVRLNTVTTPHGGVITYTYENQQYDVVDPGGQGFTLVVRTRSSSGGQLAEGTWRYTYDLGLSGLSVNTTVLTPTAQILYQYRSGGASDDLFDGEAGNAVLERRIIRDTTSLPVEREDRTYKMVPVLPWANFGTLEPETRTITRYVGAASRQYTTSYNYDTANFGDYHRPKLITETGDAGTRSTLRSYTHLQQPFIVGLPATEQVSIGSESFAKSWTYAPATGFKTAETIYGVTTAFTPDGFGNVASVTKANGKTISYTYQWGLLKDIVTAEHTTTRVINPEGTVASQTQAGRTTAFLYDDLFRVTSVTPPGGTNAIVTAYDPAGGWMRVTRGTSVLTTTVDGFGRPVATVNSVGVRTTTQYDAEGRKVYEGYPFTGADIGTTIAYDALGRVTRRTNPDGSFSQQSYGLGTVIVTDENGRATVQTFAAFGDPDAARLMAVTDADTRTWQYAYNGLDRLTTATAPDGIARTWQYYSGSDLLQQETHPESGATTFVYDAAGVLKQKTDAKGTVFTYTHDGNDRVRTIAAGGQTTAITYETGTDNVQTSSVGSVSTAFQYDAAGRRTNRTDTVDGRTFRTGSGYDANDNLTAIEYASATGTSRRRVGFDVDSEGRITRIFEGATNYASALAYHPSGAVLAYTSGNGVANAFTFDASRYWPTSVSAAGWQMTYQNYDAVGNVRTIADSRLGYTQTLNYDALDRLTTATGVYGLAAYTYDVHGNRTTSNGTSYTYEPGTLRLTQQGATTFSYDANGNTLTEGTKVLTYTPDNMQATVTAPGITAAYAYDAEQWRVKQVEQGIPTYSLRGVGGTLLTEWRSVGATAQVKDYVYAGSRLVATISRDVTEPPPPPSCPTTTDLVNLDFEGGPSLASLGFTSVFDIANQSGAGLGGSTWGVRGNPGATASQKYYGEAVLNVAHSGRRFLMEADFDHADAGYSRYGYSAFELRTRNTPTQVYQWYVSLYHGVGDTEAGPRDKLELYLAQDPDGFPAWVSGNGVIVPGTTQRITMCGTLSTVTDGEINADGSVKVYVDGVLQVALTNRVIGNQPGGGGGTIKQVFINPMGRFDHFRVAQE